MRFLRTSALLAMAGLAAGCVGSNVTLGTAADDPEVPHRAPTAPARRAASASAPEEPAPPTPAPPSSSPAAVPAPTPAGSLVRPLGDPVALAAEPCQAKGLHVRAVVPNPEDLDTSYRGAVPGIEIRRTVRSGTAGHRNASHEGGTLEVDLWVRGGGLVAGAVGFETCTGGSPGDASFEIVAHYRH